MDVLFEQKLVQNPALGAEAIWHAANEAFEISGATVGLPLPLSFLILPIVFHKESATTLSGKTQPGAMYKALSENREIIVGLQKRIESMSDRTLIALSFGFDSKLILLDADHEKTIIPGRKTAPINHVTNEVKIIMQAAKRVGQSFLEMTIPQLLVQLNIRF